MVNTDLEAGPVEVYTVLHCTVPLGLTSAWGYTVNESREMEATSAWGEEIPPLLTTNDFGLIMYKKCKWMCEYNCPFIKIWSLSLLRHLNETDWTYHNFDYTMPTVLHSVFGVGGMLLTLKCLNLEHTWVNLPMLVTVFLLLRSFAW
jgi:hypothetical protein